jgi:hypothetical protein
MNLKEVKAKGITKIRLAKWANPDAYIELCKLPNGKYGPWTTLHDSWGERVFTKEEYDGIKKTLIWQIGDNEDWQEYIPETNIIQDTLREEVKIE